MERKVKKQRKLKHGSLGEKISKKRKYSEEETEDIERATDIFSFENYCINCDHYNTEECPFIEMVGPATEWRKIGCKNFWD